MVFLLCFEQLYDMFGYLNPAELPSTSAGDLSGKFVFFISFIYTEEVS